MSVNRQILVGNLGNEPETIHFDNGNSITKFSLATSEKWRDKQTNDVKESTTWHNIVCNAKVAELAQKWLSKGDKVYIEGKTKHRKYEQDGITKYITEVYVSQLQFLTLKKSNSNTNQGAGNNEPDDLPF